jgi:dolichol-phosphate mannosyltransferase
MSGAHRELASRLGKFLVVGGTGVLLNNAALFTLYQVLRLPLIVSSTVAVVLAIGNNFFLNDRWTFQQRQDPFATRRLVRFSLVSLGGLALTTLTLWVLVTYLGVHYMVANLVGIGIGTGSNFIGNMKWTWNRSVAQ